MKHIVIAGGSGFLGRSLARRLRERGDAVTILTRSPKTREDGVAEVAWDGTTLGPWTSTIDGADCVVNMTGKSVDCRYTATNRSEIVRSRVDSVRVLAAAISSVARKPKTYVQAASLAIYGDAGDAILSDNTAPGVGFSPDVCVRWEREVADANFGHGVLKSVLRIGFVLGTDGGALKPLSRITRAYLGGTVGSGTQYISWLHARDLDAMFCDAIDGAIGGTFNATGPSPVTNSAFMSALRKALHRPWSPPTPALAVRLGSVFLRTEPELALTGRRCVPTRLLDNGFRFAFTDLDVALADIFSESRDVSRSRTIDGT